MVETFCLDNGIKVLIKDIPTASSVSVGIFSLVGLLQEPKGCNGIAHFLEHMAFKGTNKRTAKKITEGIDNIGGKINAFTAKEYTCYYITVLEHVLNKGLDILFDVYLNSKLSDSDILMEKQVVMEEINMYEDTPDEHIHDNFISTIWGKNKLGLPILGATKNLDNIDKQILLKFKDNYLNPDNIIIAAAGKITNTKKFISTIKKFSDFKVVKGKNFFSYRAKPNPYTRISMQKKDTEQIHFCIGGQGVSFSDEDHYKVTLLGTLLGGSMSSRLFQSIREKKGWAYSVYSYPSFYRHSGLFTIYAGVNKEKFIASLRLIIKELTNFKEKKITEKELRKGKEQLKGNLILSLERSSAWVSWMGRSTIYFNKVYLVEEIMEKIEQVTIADIIKISQKLFVTEKMALASIGPFKDKFLAFNNQNLQGFLGSNKLVLA